jgi:hypothetical protein
VVSLTDHCSEAEWLGAKDRVPEHGQSHLPPPKQDYEEDVYPRTNRKGEDE